MTRPVIFKGVPPRLEMYVTQEQRVVVFCHFSAYSEVLTCSESGVKLDVKKPFVIDTQHCPNLSSRPGGKIVRFFPSDGRYEFDGKPQNLL